MSIKAKCLVALGAFIILTIMGYLLLPKEGEVVIQTTNEKIEEYIYVHIEGCVNNPGLLKVKKGTRLYEVIELSGGMTETADTSKINLASIVLDEQKVYIPEIQNEILTESENMGVSYSHNNKIVNINTADSNILQTLEGIGPGMAKKIIEYRNQNGNFNTLEEIKNVSGIGESKYNNIKENITI